MFYSVVYNAFTQHRVTVFFTVRGVVYIHTA